MLMTFFTLGIAAKNKPKRKKGAPKYFRLPPEPEPQQATTTPAEKTAAVEKGLSDL